MATKTKNELMAEIEALNKEMKGLKDEVKKLERYKVYADTTDEIAAMRDSFVNSGFTKAEAFELVKLIVANSINMNNSTISGVSYKSYRCR